MTTKQIKQVLGPLDILVGCNMYPDEPMPSAHAVSVKKGTAKQAIEAINNAGGYASHAYAFGPYSESINVRRKG